jgi:hypothetical protein
MFAPSEKRSMPAKDFYHDHVRNALINDGWTITHEQMRIPWQTTSVLIDLGAERLIEAEKGSRKIAVEVKSFLGVSELAELYSALGQFILYRNALAEHQPERTLFLALRESAFNHLFTHRDGESLRAREEIKLLVFDEERQEILQWIE